MSGIATVLARPGARVHLVGAGGSGMAGLAILLLERGCRVSGSDLGRGPVVEALVARGLEFHAGHAAAHMGAAELLVYSSAVPADNPERREAARRGVPEARRAEALAALLAGRKVIAVSGTHGKTTTSSMLAQALRRAGLEPGHYVGAEVPALGASAAWGNGPWMVLEADESDGSFAAFAPEILVVLNIEAEHLDHYRDLAEIEAAFAAVAARTRGAVVWCADDPGAARLGAGLAPGRGISYGFDGTARLRVEVVELGPGGSRARFWSGGTDLGEGRVGVPGRHNVGNAAAVVAAALRAGAAFGPVAEALGEFRGARRRFEVKLDSAELMIVDDYAHHPSEIRATLATARRAGRKRVVAAFQPHRFSRTAKLADQFGESFADADRLYLTEIYAASEPNPDGVTGRVIEATVRTAGGDPDYVGDLGRLERRLWVDWRDGDLLLTMGAGDIQKVAEGLVRREEEFRELRARLSPGAKLVRGEPLAKHTTMRIGGPADIWCEPANEEDLRAVADFCRGRGVAMTLLGRGSNLLVRDGGIPGVVAHLGQPGFSRIEVRGTEIHAGAGARLNMIVAAARKAGLGGLEFMEGIPASLGGALRMNAGAMGGWMFDAVASVRVMEPDGAVREMRGDEFEVAYRSVPKLARSVALSAVLRGSPAPPERIAERLKEFSGKRWGSQPAMPSAGCVFKNPEACPAGKLIDELGLKDTRVGGARVSREHGNFIVNDGGARAADVLELIEIVRERARRERNIELETEVVILGEDA